MKSILSKFGGSKQPPEKSRPADAEPKVGQTDDESGSDSGSRRRSKSFSSVKESPTIGRRESNGAQDTIPVSRSENSNSQQLEEGANSRLHRPSGAPPMRTLPPVPAGPPPTLATRALVSPRSATSISPTKGSDTPEGWGGRVLPHLPGSTSASDPTERATSPRRNPAPPSPSKRPGEANPNLMSSDYPHPQATGTFQRSKSHDMEARRAVTPRSAKTLPAPPTFPPPQPPTTSTMSQSMTNITAMDPAERRMRTVSEILTTEKSYVAGLHTLVDVFMNGLRSLDKGSMSAKLSTIFSNVEVILRFNTEFCQELGTVIANYNPTTLIGTVFIKMAPFLKMYTLYASNYQSALDALAECRENSTFSAALEQLRAAAGNDIEAFLIMPIQRIPRYELLLRDLLKCTTDDHPDYHNINEALKNMKQIAEHVNSFVKQYQNSARAMQLGLEVRPSWGTIYAAMFDFIRVQSMLAPHRRLIRDGILTADPAFQRQAKRIPLQLILFNDILLKNENAKKKIHAENIKYRWPVRLIWVKDGVPLSGPGMEAPFELIGPDGSYMVYAATHQEKIKWMNDFSTAINEAEANDIKQDPDARYGAFTYLHGGHYDGWWLTGKRHGMGTFSLLGTKYVGEWFNDQKHGEGRISYMTGALYQGQWQYDKPHGYGIFVDENGDQYEGSWREGIREGVGRLTFANGSVYEGSFVAGRIEGRGKFYTVTGMRYEGDWVANQFEGQGTLITSRRKQYIGSFMKGIKHGKGRMQYPDGSFYDGEYSNNQRNGQGTMNRAACGGTTYVGSWFNGEMEGHGILCYSDNSKYEGSFKGGQFHGTGSFLWTHSVLQKYQGEWYRGVKNGKGTLYYTKGARYEGSFRDDQLHGNGVMHLPNGVILDGKWTNGKLEGKFVVKGPPASSSESKKLVAALLPSGCEVEFPDDTAYSERTTKIPYLDSLPTLSIPASWTMAQSSNS